MPRRLWAGIALFCAACGGGGGATAAAALVLDSIVVMTEPVGPLSPFGTTAGGDRVEIHGSGFRSGLEVRVGAAPAQVEQVADALVVAVTPPGPAGLATVEVENPNGDVATLPGVFRYIAPPAILSAAAVDGPTAGEARVSVDGNSTLEIRGTDFQDGIEVLIAGKDAAETFVDEGTVRATAPSATGEGAVDIVVRNPEGLSATLAGGLFYTQEFSLAPEIAFGDARARHLYRRAAFGAPPPVIATATRDGIGATVGRLMAFTNDTTVEQAALAMYGTTPPPSSPIGGRTNKQWWIHLLLRNPNPFQERLAWFLHDHFATSERNFDDYFRWTIHFQIQLFRRMSVATGDRLANGASGLGYDWRNLLVEVAKDRAMLEWLNGRVSVRGAPNENFARELWELFMLGESNGYTEADIQEAARAFTGFFAYLPRLPVGNTTYDIAYAAQRHDERSKTILGATGFFGYDSISPFYVVSGNPITTDPAVETDPRDTDGGVIDLTLRQRPVEASRHICRKLWEYFVYADPSDVVIDPLAAQLRAPGRDQWNLRPVIETMLESKAMYSARAMKGAVKSPVDYVFGFLRTTGVRLHPTNPATEASRIYNSLVELDQIVLEPPDVNGWPTGAAWAGAQPMLERTNFLALAVKALDDITLDIGPLLPPATPTPPVLVDHLARILDVSLTASARAELIDYVNSGWANGAETNFPYDPNNPDDVKRKTRGLVWMIAQYHDAHRN
jgi:uncharacterized protein (DUF1800 family)